MRTTKTERKENAIRFYNAFMNGNCNRIAVVVNRMESANPNISRCQFIAVASPSGMENPIVIAESVEGVTGCYIELLENIKKCPQKTYFEDGFNKWLKKTYNFEITYKDGLVFMFEK